MVEQIKSVGFHSRQARLICKAPKSLMDDVQGILSACLSEPREACLEGDRRPTPLLIRGPIALWCHASWSAALIGALIGADGLDTWERHLAEAASVDTFRQEVLRLGCARASLLEELALLSLRAAA
jgi:hypothetical protein